MRRKWGLDQKKLKDTITLGSVDGDLTISNGFFQVYADRHNNEYITAENGLILDIDYYFSHSGEKWVSPLYIKWDQMLDEDSPYYIEGLNCLAIDKIVDIVYTRYHEKWDKIYNALLVQDYNFLNNYGFSESHTETTTEDNVITHEIDEDTSYHGTSATDTNLRTENNNTTYGFNSSVGVPTDDSVEVTTGSSNDNITTNNNTGTKDATNVDTEDKGGTRNYSKTITGYKDLEPEEAIESEITLRNKHIFYEIIMKDVDAIFTLQIY